MKQFKRANAVKYVKRDLRELEKLGIDTDFVTEGRSVESLAWNSKSYEKWRREVRKAKKFGFTVNEHGVPISNKDMKEIEKLVEARNKKTSDIIEKYKKDNVVTKTDLHYLAGGNVISNGHDKMLSKNGYTTNNKIEDITSLITSKKDIQKEIKQYKKETDKLTEDKLIEVDSEIKKILDFLEGEGMKKTKRDLMEINIGDMGVVEKQILIDVWTEFQQHVESATKTDSRYIGEIYLAFDKIVTDRVHNRGAKVKAI